MTPRPVNLLLPIPVDFGMRKLRQSVVIQTVMTEAILMISARTPQRIWNCKKKESELFDLTMC